MKNIIILIIGLFTLYLSINRIAYCEPSKGDQINVCVFIVACLIYELKDKK